MRSLGRMLVVLLIAGVGAYVASQTASASVEAGAQRSCSVELDGRNIAAISIEPAPFVDDIPQIFRQGRAIEIDDWVTGADGNRVVAQLDLRVPNERAVHYSVFTGDGNPRLYCGSIAPVMKTCSVSVTAGNPVVGWSDRSADRIWRNGKVIQSGYGGDEDNVGIIYTDYRYVDHAAGAVGQLGHYSVEWQDGSRTYCGNVTVPGRSLACELAVYYEGLPYVRIQAAGFTGGNTPGKGILFRNGKQVPWISFFDETNGLLDGEYTPNETNHYSLAWRNDQGQVGERVYCGSIVPPERF